MGERAGAGSLFFFFFPPSRGRDRVFNKVKLGGYSHHLPTGVGVFYLMVLMGKALHPDW